VPVDESAGFFLIMGLPTAQGTSYPLFSPVVPISESMIEKGADFWVEIMRQNNQIETMSASF